MFSVARTLAALSLLTTASCATSFTGDAHYPGGPAGCQAACGKQGLTMGAFVYAGEYSSACVCAPRAQAGSKLDSSGAVAAGAVGVITQMRAAEDRRAMLTQSQNTNPRR